MNSEVWTLDGPPSSCVGKPRESQYIMNFYCPHNAIVMSIPKSPTSCLDVGSITRSKKRCWECCNLLQWCLLNHLELWPQINISLSLQMGQQYGPLVLKLIEYVIHITTHGNGFWTACHILTKMWHSTRWIILSLIYWWMYPQTPGSEVSVAFLII